MKRFVNRSRELASLERWWSDPAGGLALVWGRRRVGKTALVQQLAADKPTIFHTGSNRPAVDELWTLSRLAAGVIDTGMRDLHARPFIDWADALETLAEAARAAPLLLVLDEFPELVKSAPEIEGVIRALWDRAQGATKLRILLCGSATRTMEAIQQERSPLFGRVHLRLMLHPFLPHEVAEMLPDLSPADRALVWGLVGGVPLYLEWWDQRASIRENLERLVCTPGGRLLTEGAYVLATEGSSTDLARQILSAIAAGRTRYNEIETAVRASPARVLDALVELRLVERQVPVTESPRLSRRRIYRIADGFLAFWLGVVARYRTEIDRGLGPTILNVMLADLDDHMGRRWEEAFRLHLRRLAAEGALDPEVVAIGPWWRSRPTPVEIDAVVLSGRGRRATLVGEAKWARREDSARLLSELHEKAEALPRVSKKLTCAICSREQVRGKGEHLRITAEDIFSS